MGNLVLLTETESLDFMNKLIKEVDIFGIKYYITTTHISVLIVAAALLTLSLFVNRVIKKANAEDTPGTFQNIMELILEMIEGLIHSVMGVHAKKFINYIMFLMFFLLLSNWSGLFGLRPPTADYSLTFPLGLMSFCVIHFSAMKAKKGQYFKDYLKPFWPFLPINIIGDATLPITMSLRLFGNILSGTILLGLIYQLAPLKYTTGTTLPLHVFFDVFAGLVQTFVFSMLTMVFISTKLSD